MAGMSMGNQAAGPLPVGVIGAVRLAHLDGDVFGLPPLTGNGVQTILDDSKAVRLIVNKATGAPEGYLAFRTEPGGWGIIETIALKKALGETAHRIPVSSTSKVMKKARTRCSMDFQEARIATGVRKVVSSTRNKLIPSTPTW